MSFSSKTYDPSNERIMSKPSVKADPAGKFMEKDQMVGLNDKFVKLIDKVKNLEDEKKILETKLKILKGQEAYSGNVNAIVKQATNELKEKIDNLKRDQEKLNDELEDTQNEVEDAKKSYEDEVTKRTNLESDFIISKKELDISHLDLVKDVLELEDLTRKLEFLRAGYDEEIKELESMVKNETVIIPSPNKRSLDVTEYVRTIENQYANMAAHARDEAEQWNQRKIESLVQSAGQKEQEVRDIKREISDILRQIQRLSGDLDGLKRKEESLKNEIEETRKDGEGDMENARSHIKLLEDSLKSLKQELARQIRQHQELLNLKLALDIEIATYRQLLMGEEQRYVTVEDSELDLVNLHKIKISKKQTTNPSPYLHAEVHLPERKHRQEERHLPEREYLREKHLQEKPPAVESTVVPNPSETLDPTQEPPAATAPSTPAKKRLLIRLQVESGRVVSEFTQYSE
ncbi:hypothetical protein CRENBAI_010045 [Crenichthys baileyi]|uniref:Keratin, type II cytoskeletal 8 n=1 Tax=Crenichthys baileyi TaxID=28760 RepID=A0AAV9S551_9TELE